VQPRGVRLAGAAARPEPLAPDMARGPSRRRLTRRAAAQVLATLHFADPLTPIPGAISACAHSILGSALAGFWRVRDGRAARTAAAAAGGAGGGGLAGDLASSRAQA